MMFEAMEFAREAHKDQRRKYTNNPYTDHLAEVAGIVATVAYKYEYMQEAVIATAWLHDCIEDQDVSVSTLVHEFGEQVMSAVLQLSDLAAGNRTERKAASRTRLSGAWSWVQSIKVADLISNTSSIVQHDPKFAVTYLEEKRMLLDVLTKADPRLISIARQQLRAAAVG